MNGLGVALAPGIYRVLWKDGGGESVAAVGICTDGRRWIAPTNWVLPTANPEIWKRVQSVERIDA